MSGNPYDIAVSVISEYIERESVPDQKRYVFAYHVTISNVGAAAAQLISRHWVIADASGHVQEVRGDGVVGEQPRLEPGDTFKYTSAAMIETPLGSMHGSYFMRADDGHEFEASITAFRLSVPNILH